jgi:hypothetical protein
MKSQFALKHLATKIVVRFCILPATVFLVRAILPNTWVAQAQEAHLEGTVTVTIDANKVRNFVAPRAMGMHTSVYDNILPMQKFRKFCGPQELPLFAIPAEVTLTITIGRFTR